MYRLLRTLFKPLIGQFFSQITIEGSALVESGPVLIIANHHNQMLDPFLVSCAFKRDCWFLAKSTLFKNVYIAKFLRSAHMIPVYRIQDDASNMHKNDETFKEVVEHLLQGRAVVIFPEGTSRSERKIGEFKTGAARIALQAEAARNFTLGLQVQAIGLTYSSLTEFRSSVSLTASEPLAINKIENSYRNDARSTVKELTNNLSDLLRTVAVELPEERQNILAEKIAKLIGSNAEPGSKANSDYELLKRISVCMHSGIALHDPAILALEQRIERFLELSQVFGLNSRYLDSSYHTMEAYFLCGVTSVGTVINYFPYKLVGKIVNKISQEPVLLASNKFIYGLIIFSIYYLSLALLSMLIIKSFMIGIFVFLLLLAVGHTTNKHLEHLRIFMIGQLWPGQIKPTQILRSMRNELVEELLNLEKIAKNTVGTAS